MNGLDQWFRAEIGQFALEVARIAGVTVTAPIPWAGAPKQVRAAVVIFLALLVHGQAPTTVQDLDALLLATVLTVSEFMAGAAMGFVVYLVIATAEFVGSTVAPIMGFGAAQVFDPSTGSSESVLTRVLQYLALLLAITSGLHRVLLGSLVASFRVVPVGTLTHWSMTTEYFVELTSGVLTTGVRLALPVLVALLMVQLALGFVSRAAPAMQIFNIGFAVLLAVGALVLMLALPDFAQEMLAQMSHVGERIETFLLLVSGA